MRLDGCVGKGLARLHALYLRLQDIQLLPEATPELPSGLQRMLLSAGLFLAAWSTTGLAATKALALGWDLRLAALRLLEAGLLQ